MNAKEKYEAEIVEEALDAAVLVILRATGDKTGDFAGCWFADGGDPGSEIRAILERFYKAQSEYATYAQQGQ